MEEYCKEKTISVCHYKTFLFEVMPFGLRNARATFWRAMETMLEVFEFVRVYLDNIFIFSKPIDDHIDDLASVLERIERNDRKLMITECNFIMAKIDQFVHVDSEKSIEVN